MLIIVGMNPETKDSIRNLAQTYMSNPNAIMRIIDVRHYRDLKKMTTSCGGTGGFLWRQVRFQHRCLPGSYVQMGIFPPVVTGGPPSHRAVLSSAFRIDSLCHDTNTKDSLEKKYLIHSAPTTATNVIYKNLPCLSENNQSEPEGASKGLSTPRTTAITITING